MNILSASDPLDLLLRNETRKLELLAEHGHLSVNWFAARSGDFQPRSFADLALLSNALLLAQHGTLGPHPQQLAWLEGCITDALVTKARPRMQQAQRALTAVELQDMGVTEGDAAKASPRRSRSRFSMRLREELHTTWPALYRRCIAPASQRAEQILAAEWELQQQQRHHRQRMHEPRPVARRSQAG